MIVFNIVTATLTAVVAVIATYVAYQQLALASEKRVLELYDRRSKIFKGTMEFIRRILRHWEVTEDSLDQFVRDTAETSFFFDTDIEEFIEMLRDKGGDLFYAVKERPNPAPRVKPAQDSTVWNQDKLVDWFGRQPKHATDLFKPYLKIGTK
jgi:hypothetical protein